MEPGVSDPDIIGPAHAVEADSRNDWTGKSPIFSVEKAKHSTRNFLHPRCLSPIIQYQKNPSATNPVRIRLPWKFP